MYRVTDRPPGIPGVEYAGKVNSASYWTLKTETNNNQNSQEKFSGAGQVQHFKA